MAGLGVEMRTTIEAFSDVGPSKASAGLSIPTRTGRIALSVEIPRAAWDAMIAKWRRGFITDTVSGLDEDEVIGAIGEIVGNGGESYGTMAPGLASGAGPWASMLQGLGGQGSPLGAMGSQLGGTGGLLGGFGQMLAGLGGQGASQGGGLGQFGQMLAGLGGQGASQGGGTGGGTELERLIRAASVPAGTDWSALAGGLGTAGGAAAGSLLGPAGTALGGALGSALGPLIASLIPTTTRIARATPAQEAASFAIQAMAPTMTAEQLRSIGWGRSAYLDPSLPFEQQTPEAQALIRSQPALAPGARPLVSVVETGVRPRVAGFDEDLPGLAHGLASTVLGLDDGVESLREIVGATLLEQASRSPLVLEMDDRIFPMLRRAIKALDAKSGARSGSEEAVAALDRAYSHPDPSVRSALRMSDSLLGG